MIAIVDYGAGNLASVVKALRAAGGHPHIVKQPRALHDADAIVVPGVGHFGATAAIDAAWRDAIREAIARGTPLLGICLGMQWLYESSDEAPDLPGFGMIRGRVFRLTGDVKVPHVGWNTLGATGASRLVSASEEGAAVYFTHSFAAPITGETTAATAHGVPFAAIVECGNVTGMQFHPEKSGAAGLRLLSRWVSHVPRRVNAV